MKINSIEIKIMSLIIFIFIVIILVALYITVNTQKNNLISATQKTLSINTEILNHVIRNIMLNGEAPIAVNTMSSLREIEDFKEISIFRVDGTNAFNDYKTIDQVNNFQNKVMFVQTPRVEKNILKNINFQKVLDSKTPVTVELTDKQEMEYFFPILNYTECRACHGDSDFVRGVAHFNVSIKGIYKQIDQARTLMTLFFIIIGVVFAIILIYFMRSMIIKPILIIGDTVKEVGNGNFEVKVVIKNKDELGDLSNKINDMIRGVKERFKLSKYISKSTEDLIKKDHGYDSEGIKKQITVLFADIRGFTAYSSTRTPSEVVKNLNTILQVEADVVEEFGGDIDKFVGDELMATFEDELTAVRCSTEIIKKVIEINKNNNTELFVGIGINSGEVIAAHIGSKNRTEFAVIGDAVNFASRLCSIAKQNMILLSENVNNNLKNKIETIEVSDQKIKGIAEPVSIYILKSIK